MSARQDIMARLRRNLGGDEGAKRRDAAEAWLAARQRGPQPNWAEPIVARFRQQAERLASTVDITSAAGLPAAVAAYLEAHGRGRRAVADAEMAGYAWAESGLALHYRPACDTDQVGITGCFCAIAETGSLLLISSPDTPASISLLPEVHVAVVPVARIVPRMEDAFALLRAECPVLPRALSFISGPSRTGDIEQTLVLGAHGPCQVHIILLEDAA